MFANIQLTDKMLRYPLAFGVTLVLFLICAEVASAGNYQPLVGLPQVAGQTGQTLSGYFNQIYIVTIAVGAILAFIKIAMAGVQYSLTDIVTSKEDAKKSIKGALLGLAILLIPFIVLNTIYPGLTNLNVLDTARNNAIRLDQPVNSQAAPVSTDPGTIARPGDARVGLTITNCAYTPISSGVGMDGEPIYVGFDDSTCRAQCVDLRGTFTQVNSSGGYCTYYVGTICNPLNGDVCDGGSPGGA